MRTQSIAGNVWHIVWSAETADNRYGLGTDTLVVRGGRISHQPFAGKIVSCA